MIPLLLAALICIENGDGTWTCSSDGPSVGPDSGIVVDPSGSYVCTNCTAISSNECERIKHLVMSNCDAIVTAALNTRGYARDLEDHIRSLVNTFSSFTNCPYHYSSTPRDLTSQIGYDPSLSSIALRNEDLWNKMNSSWQSSPNFTIVNLAAVPPTDFNYPSMYRSVNYLVGLWESSYAVSHNSIQQLSNALATIQGVYNGTYRSEATATDLYIQTRDTVTCAPCTLGSSSGGGGGSGSQTGCLDCYLNHLARIDSNLDSIDDALQSIKPQLESYMTRVKSVIERNFDAPISSITNILGRIDDYLIFDQQRYLSTITEAVISITNNLPDNMLHYFEDYNRADAFKDHDDDNFDLAQVVSEVQTGGGPVWSNLTWFSRIEALLASSVGFGSTLDETVSSDVESSHDDAMAAVEADSAGNTARESVSGLFETLEDVFDSLNIFGSVSEPSYLTLLDSAALPLHGSSGTAAVTVSVPDIPAIFTFLRFIRYAFIAFYWILALISFVFAVIWLYRSIVSLIRWATNFIGSIFAG